MSIKWENDLDFDAVSEEMAGRMIQALGQGAELLRSYVSPLVPVQTGNLVGSGGITVNGGAQDTPYSAELLYPGPYALYQHEGVYYRHGRYGAPLTHNHGESFFVESQVVAHGAQIIDFMGQIVGGS
jgi:hypothetical protein